jgi:uncharacterized membrane protein (DUF2068 family)
VRPEDALVARESGGLRWHRCLRCDSWLALSPPDQPGRQHPPDRHEIEIPLRGKALRDRFVLRLIAVDRVVHFIALCSLGIAVLFLAAHERSLKQEYYRILTALQRGVGGGPVQTRGHHTGILGEVDKLFSLQSGHLREVGAALLAYGILEGIEGIGLWYGKRWAEYLTFVAVTVLLPLEIYELLNGVTALKLIGFIINVAIVLFLLFSKRLFGLRGGGAADERERMRDMSWEAIERATPPRAQPVAG